MVLGEAVPNYKNFILVKVEILVVIEILAIYTVDVLVVVRVMEIVVATCINENVPIVDWIVFVQVDVDNRKADVV